MRQIFKPEKGKLAVIREAEVALRKQFKEAGLETSHETITEVRRVNPWGMVVGIGLPRGESTTEAVLGQKVLVSEVGRYVELVSSDGQVDFIYVLPFEGVLGRLEFECEKCGWSGKIEPKGMRCPNCPTLVTPTLQETQMVGMARS